MMSPASRFIRCISSRAVVDLPQPDSPTIPTVSPLAMEKETSSTARTVLRGLNRSPRTGKCFVNPVTCNSGCAAPPTSATGSSSATDAMSDTNPSVELLEPVADVGGEDHRDRDQTRCVDEDRAE